MGGRKCFALATSVRHASSADVMQVEVPSIGSPEEDPKTVELKLRQVQKEKGTMKVGLLADTFHLEGCCSATVPLFTPCLLSNPWDSVNSAWPASHT